MFRPDDRAFHPGRVVGHDPRPPVEQPPTVHMMGADHDVDDLGWLLTNAEHAQTVTIAPVPGPGALVQAHGDNPLTGPWDFKVSWADRNAARDWFSHPRWEHTHVSDTIRDGGY